MKNLLLITLSLILSFVAFQSRADIYPVTKSDKEFFQQLKQAVLKNDIKWLSEAVSYPIVIKTEKARYRLQNKEDFATHSKIILTSHLKSTLQNQSMESLFKNWQGVMIGNGDIWFSEVAETAGNEKTWIQRIIAINLPEN